MSSRINSRFILNINRVIMEITLLLECFFLYKHWKIIHLTIRNKGERERRRNVGRRITPTSIFLSNVAYFIISRKSFGSFCFRTSYGYPFFFIFFLPMQPVESPVPRALLFHPLFTTLLWASPLLSDSRVSPIFNPTESEVTNQSIYRLSILIDARSTDIRKQKTVLQSITLSIDQIEYKRNIMHENCNICRTIISSKSAYIVKMVKCFFSEALTIFPFIDDLEIENWNTSCNIQSQLFQ